MAWARFKEITSRYWAPILVGTVGIQKVAENALTTDCAFTIKEIARQLNATNFNEIKNMIKHHAAHDASITNTFSLSIATSMFILAAYASSSLWPTLSPKEQKVFGGLAGSAALVLIAAGVKEAIYFAAEKNLRLDGISSPVFAAVGIASATALLWYQARKPAPQTDMQIQEPTERSRLTLSPASDV